MNLILTNEEKQAVEEALNRSLERIERLRRWLRVPDLLPLTLVEGGLLGAILTQRAESLYRASSQCAGELYASIYARQASELEQIRDRLLGTSTLPTSPPPAAVSTSGKDGTSSQGG